MNRVRDLMAQSVRALAQGLCRAKRPRFEPGGNRSFILSPTI